MNFSETLESVMNFTVEAANTAVDKAKQLAAIAKANIAIVAEEDKVRKAEQQLGKLYYRDYAVGEERDEAEYLPWCQKIDEAKQTIARLRDEIEDLKAACGETNEQPAEAEAEPAEAVEVEVLPLEEAPAAPEADVVIEIESTDKPEE